MSADNTPPPSAQPSPGSSGPGASARRRGPIVIPGLAFVLGALAAAIAVMSALSFLDRVWQLLVASVFALLLPAFLALRARAALVRRGTGPTLRALVTTFLFLLVHFTTVAVVLQWTDRTVGDLAKTTRGLLDDTAGEVPVLSRVLDKIAQEAGTTVVTTPTADDGVDGGVAASVDAGTPEAEDTPPAPEKAPATGPLGKVVVSAAVALRTGTTAEGVAVIGVDEQGHHDVHYASLAGLAHGLPLSRLDLGPDGYAAAILGTTTVVIVPPRGEARTLSALARGAKVPTPKVHDVVKARQDDAPASREITREARKDISIHAVRDLLVGPKGAILAVVDVVEDTGKKAQLKPTLVLWRAGKALTVVRKSGDSIPEAATGKSRDYALKDFAPDGSFVIAESFTEDDVDVALSLDDEIYSMNPSRLLVGHVDNPKALAEIARTEDATPGLKDRSFQAFQDASILPDGRVLFDANFRERGAEGWVFEGRAPNRVRAVLEGRFDAGGAPWGKEAPRLMDLDVEPYGSLAFASRGGDLIVGALDRLTAVSRIEGPNLVDESGKRMGRGADLRRPLLSAGGNLLLAEATLEGTPNRAIVLIHKDRPSEARVLLVEGGKLEDKRGGALRVKRVQLMPRAPNPLWRLDY